MWSLGMIVVASMFAVVNGYIVATILTSARGRHGHKERMDTVLVRAVLCSAVIVHLEWDDDDQWM